MGTGMTNQQMVLKFFDDIKAGDFIAALASMDDNATLSTWTLTKTKADFANLLNTEPDASKVMSRVIVDDQGDRLNVDVVFETVGKMEYRIELSNCKIQAIRVRTAGLADGNGPWPPWP